MLFFEFQKDDRWAMGQSALEPTANREVGVFG